MMYELLYPLSHEVSWLSWLNVLRYTPFRAIMATITATTTATIMATSTATTMIMGTARKRSDP